MSPAQQIRAAEEKLRDDGYTYKGRGNWEYGPGHLELWTRDSDAQDGDLILFVHGDVVHFFDERISTVMLEN